jgi:hypothetical protein
MSNANNLLDQMVEALVKDKLAAIAEKRANEMISSLTESSTLTTPTPVLQDHPKARKRASYRIKAPAHGIMHLTKPAQRDRFAPGTYCDFVYRFIQSLDDKGEMPCARRALTAKIIEEFKDMNVTSVSVMISKFFEYGLIQVEKRNV